MSNNADTQTDLVSLVYAGWQAERALRDRRDEILNAIEEGKVLPTQDILEELFDLNVALGDA